MSCERYRDALTDAAAGEPAAPALAAHLAECRTCAVELEDVRRLMAAADDELSALATARPSPALLVRIREAAAATGLAPTRRWSFVWPLAAAAVVAVAAIGVWRTAGGRPPAGTPIANVAPPPALVGSAPSGETPTSSPTAPASLASSTGPGGSTPAAPSVRRPSSLRSGSVRAAHRAAPEVLVPPGGEAELLRYVSLVHREGLLAPALSLAGEPSAALAELSPIDVRPLEIVPLDPAQESGT